MTIRQIRSASKKKLFVNVNKVQFRRPLTFKIRLTGKIVQMTNNKYTTIFEVVFFKEELEL